MQSDKDIIGGSGTQSESWGTAQAPCQFPIAVYQWLSPNDFKQRVLITWQLWGSGAWKCLPLGLNRGTGRQGSHGRLQGRICFLMSSSFGWLLAFFVCNLFYFHGQRHSIFKSPPSRLFSLTMTFPTPSSMDHFLLSPHRQLNLICHLKGLNQVCHYIHLCLEIRLTSLGGPSLGPADSLTIPCSLGTETGISWKWSLHVSTFLWNQQLCCHGQLICSFVMSPMSVKWETYPGKPLCLTRLVLSACVPTHFTHCHTFKSYRIMAYLKPIFYL